MAGRRSLLLAACLAALGPALALASPPAHATPAVHADRTRASTAARAYGWGQPAWREEFDRSRLRSVWGVFDSPGNGGNGLRRPSQVRLGGGVLTIAGTPEALTGGLALDRGLHRYGRWETRLRTRSSGTGSPYHAVLALIPHDLARYHCGATDIDVAEYDLGAPVGFFLHALPARQHYASVRRDTTRWHTYAVEVTRRSVTWFVDGRAVVTDRDATMTSGIPLALDLQLDAFQPAGLARSTMQVDWTRYYPLRGHTRPVKAPAPRTTTYDYAC
ncbi:glycoside hydrolase family 16 protein [Nocardioides mangrovicus]|nr:glycoside hydrolase family 16 protein [Nocardioides mangrovicus]